jgi:cytochrome c oxidase subunit 4
MDLSIPSFLPHHLREWLMEEKKSPVHLVDYRVYIYIWIGLLLLTGVTIYVAGLHFGKFSTLVAILIASVKTSLVLYIFMHLKYEDRIFKVILLVTIATLTLIIGMTFLDVGYR